MAWGRAITCTATGVTIAGAYANEGTAATDYLDLHVLASDMSHYTGLRFVYLPLVVRLY